MILISVIIPCRNEKLHISNCVNSLVQSTLPTDQFEILVVDGMSDDGTREVVADLCKLFPNVELLDNTMQLTPYAFNIGIIRSRGKYVLITGARNVLQPNYMQACIAKLEADKRIKCVGGVMHSTYGNETGKCIAIAMSSPIGVGFGNFRAIEQDAFTDTAAVPVYDKTIFEEVGMFDEELTRNQDDEFNFRLTRKGYKILVTADTYSTYQVRGTFYNLWRQYFQYGYFKVYVNKKHRHITTYRQLAPAALIMYLFLGLLFALLFHSLRNLYFLSVAIYLIIVISFSFYKTKRITKALRVAYAIWILHAAYGLGYLKGIFDFIVLSKKINIDQKLSR
ncbi:MAG: glycosyltransferase family 2 protein [Bacteroidetes bacterium]|nr:glycosyltransferase family 2 protein [Bacteroidota bacterium]